LPAEKEPKEGRTPREPREAREPRDAAEPKEAEAGHHFRPRCVPAEVYAAVVRDRVVRDGAVVRKIRVGRRVREVGSCAAEVISAKVETGERAWEVTILFRVAVGYDPSDRDRVARTVVFFRTRVPFPPADASGDAAATSAPARPLDPLKLQPRVRVADLACNATAGEDEHVIVAELTFRTVLLLLRDQLITVCRLPSRDDD
jgi:hypothetical protein